MLKLADRARTFPHDPALRGFQILYHPGEVNRCPACGRTHWYVGRLSSECGFCGTALAPNAKRPGPKARASACRQGLCLSGSG